jgi:lipopolysaccharide export system permease protein
MSRRRVLSPTMSLYIGREYLGTLFATTLVLTAILLLAEAIELLRRVSGKADATGVVMMKMVLFKIPDMMLQLVPFTILLGTLLCFTRLSKTNELTSMRAAGVSVWQFLLPPIVVCLGIGAFNLAVLNPFAAVTLKQYEKISTDLFPGSARGLLTEGGEIWLRQDETTRDLLLHADRTHNQGTRLEGITVFEFSKQGELMHLFSAPRMVLADQAWVLSDAVRLSTDAPAERLPSVTVPTTMTAEKIQSSFTSPNTLSIWQMPDFIDTLRESGFPTLMHEMHWQRTLAMPALVLGMFLLAVPFALRLSRQGGVGQLIVVGIVAGFLFYVFNNLVGAMGLSGTLDVALAAWMPALIATLLGVALLLHVGEE